MDLFTQHQKKPPYGHRCNACNHLWDGEAPAGTTKHVLAVLKAARDMPCPACGSIGAITLRPDRYEELKAERDAVSMGVSPA